jgi:hypothetical protein
VRAAAPARRAEAPNPVFEEHQEVGMALVFFGGFVLLYVLLAVGIYVVDDEEAKEALALDGDGAAGAAGAEPVADALVSPSHLSADADRAAD